jgi:hypothetical protein
MSTSENTPWYKKPVSVILLLIFFFPVGLYLMWKHELWNKNTRWIVTGVVGIVVLAQLGKGGSNDCGCSDSDLQEMAQSLNLTIEEAQKQCCELQKMADEINNR